MDIFHVLSLFNSLLSSVCPHLENASKDVKTEYYDSVGPSGDVPDEAIACQVNEGCSKTEGHHSKRSFDCEDLLRHLLNYLARVCLSQWLHRKLSYFVIQSWDKNLADFQRHHLATVNVEVAQEGPQEEGHAKEDEEDLRFSKFVVWLEQVICKVSDHVEREQCAQFCYDCCESDSEELTSNGRPYGALGEAIPFLAGRLLGMLFLPLLMVWFQFVLEVEQLFFIALRVTVHSFYHLGVHAPLVLVDTFDERVGVPVHKCTTAACFALRCLEIVAFDALWVNLLDYWLKGLLVGVEANALPKLRRVMLFRHLLWFNAEFDFMAQLVILEVSNDLHTFWLLDALFYLHVVNIFS